ncbi:MAG TPA: hypothetical protein VKK79_02575, partial [Candidatus Lokiarchaeia archaeon]|nr:hypothetical protein [Candidatus Lokiarchaeia archaeon]
NALLKAWALYDIPEDILRGWYEIKMKYPFLDPRLPLISGEAFDVAFGFDNSTKTFSLKLDGQVAVSYFKQFVLPEIPDWTWDIIENAGNPIIADGEAEISDEEFAELTLGAGVLNIKDLKYELELLEYQVYTLPFYNSWELGEVRYKQGLTYYRLTHVDPKNKEKYFPEVLEAFNFVQGTDYKNSYNGRMVLPRLIQECSGNKRTRRQRKLLAISPESV